MTLRSKSAGAASDVDPSGPGSPTQQAQDMQMVDRVTGKIAPKARTLRTSADGTKGKPKATKKSTGKKKNGKGKAKAATDDEMSGDDDMYVDG